MSWYSDNERFDEHDPSYCKNCKRDVSYEICKACKKLHEEPEEEEVVITPSLREELYDMLDAWWEYTHIEDELIDRLVGDYYLTDDQAESIIWDWSIDRPLDDPEEDKENEEN